MPRKRNTNTAAGAKKVQQHELIFANAIRGEGLNKRITASAQSTKITNLIPSLSVTSIRSLLTFSYLIEAGRMVVIEESASLGSLWRLPRHDYGAVSGLDTSNVADILTDIRSLGEEYFARTNEAEDTADAKHGLTNGVRIDREYIYITLNAGVKELIHPDKGLGNYLRFNPTTIPRIISKHAAMIWLLGYETVPREWGRADRRVHSIADGEWATDWYGHIDFIARFGMSANASWSNRNAFKKSVLERGVKSVNEDTEFTARVEYNRPRGWDSFRIVFKQNTTYEGAHIAGVVPNKRIALPGDRVELIELIATTYGIQPAVVERQLTDVSKTGLETAIRKLKNLGKFEKDHYGLFHKIAKKLGGTTTKEGESTDGIISEGAVKAENAKQREAFATLAIKEWLKELTETELAAVEKSVGIPLTEGVEGYLYGKQNLLTKLPVNIPRPKMGKADFEHWLQTEAA